MAGVKVPSKSHIAPPDLGGDSLTSLPHLIHVGFPKCASTYLQSWFNAHPEIAFRENGFGGFHSPLQLVEGTEKATGPVRARVTSFEEFTAPVQRHAVFDTSNIPDAPPLSPRDRIASVLAQLFPTAKILIVTRGYEAVLASAYSQFVRMGTSVTFDEYTKGLSNEAAFSAVFDYVETWTRYRSAFGADSVLVLPQELLEDDPRSFLSEIESWLGVSAFSADLPRANTSLSPAALYYLPRIAKAYRRVPIGRLMHRVNHWQRGAISRGYWDRPLDIVAKWRSEDFPPLRVPEEVLDGFRGRAAALMSLPHFERYRSDYLAD